MLPAQIITDRNGAPAYAVLPWDEYTRLTRPDRPETDMSDEELYDIAKAEVGEFFPVDLAKRLVAGDHPIKVYREYRGMTQADLAARADISPMYLSQIETGNRGGSTRVIAALAKALNVDAGDLI